MSWIPQVQPRYTSPLHLNPFVEQMEGILKGIPFQFCGAAPPRHAKTESCVIAFSVWLLTQMPWLHIAYVTYGAQLSFQKSVAARELAASTGLALGAIQTAPLWSLQGGGSFRAMGIDGPFTGSGADVLLVDDPHKDRAAAESKLQRDKVHEWWLSTAQSRLEPHASWAIFMQRWHPDDLVGRLVKDGTKYTNLPALQGDGDTIPYQALWPDRWPVKLMVAKRKAVGPYNWASQYEGLPRPRGGRMFEGTFFYDELPKDGLMHGFGLDLSYSGKTSGDWSVLFHLARHRQSGKFYVINVIREQVPAPVFKKRITPIIRRWPGSRVLWYGSGTEKGSADFFMEPNPGKPGTGLPIDIEPPQGDKGVRATPFAAAWSQGEILIPKTMDERGEPINEWVNDLVTELCDFTGVKDPTDDQVDAGAAAYDCLVESWVDKFAQLATL